MKNIEKIIALLGILTSIILLFLIPTIFKNNVSDTIETWEGISNFDMILYNYPIILTYIIISVILSIFSIKLYFNKK